MAKLSDLLLDMKKKLDQFGDIQVVFKYPDNSVKDILSCGVSRADNINNEEIIVYWMSGEFVNSNVDPNAKQTSFPDE